MFILKGCPKRDYSNSNPFHINYKILLFGLQFDGPQKILWTTILRWAIIIGEWTHLPISTVLNLKRLWSVKLIDGASNLECSDRAKFIRIIQQAGCCHGHDFELWNRLLCWTKPGHVPTFQPLMYKNILVKIFREPTILIHDALRKFYFHLGIHWVMGVKIHRTSFIIMSNILLFRCDDLLE